MILYYMSHRVSFGLFSLLLYYGRWRPNDGEGREAIHVCYKDHFDTSEGSEGEKWSTVASRGMNGREEARREEDDLNEMKNDELKRERRKNAVYMRGIYKRYQDRQGTGDEWRKRVKLCERDLNSNQIGSRGKERGSGNRTFCSNHALLLFPWRILISCLSSML